MSADSNQQQVTVRQESDTRTSVSVRLTISIALTLSLALPVGYALGKSTGGYELGQSAVEKLSEVDSRLARIEEKLDNTLTQAQDHEQRLRELEDQNR